MLKLFTQLPPRDTQSLQTAQLANLSLSSLILKLTAFTRGIFAFMFHVNNEQKKLLVYLKCMHMHISIGLIIFIDLQYYQYAYIGTDTNNNIGTPLH